MTSITREPLSFTSHDGVTTISAYLWKAQDAATPSAIVQLVHGMEEHIERYDAFARYLAGRNMVVCGHSHLGHGGSVSSSSQLGCLPVRGGDRILVEDTHALRLLVDEKLGPQAASAPHVAFGHSMGSFVVLSYITSHGQGLSGAIICGTGFIPVAASTAGNALARAIARVRGAEYKSKLLDKMGVGAYNKQIPNPRTGVDWLSYDTGNVDDYLADDGCGFAFSAGGYATLTALTAQVCAPASAALIPKDLPLLYIAGAEDPVGDFGKGVQSAAQLARDAGVRDVSCALYEHMRHEILSETDRERVWSDVASWIEDHVGA